MKKSAFLAISVASFGVIGLAGFAPMVSAADTATSTATVSLTVQGSLALGEGTGADGSGTFTNGALDANFGTMNAGTAKVDANAISKNLKTINNTGSNANLSVYVNGSSSAMVGSGTASGGNIAYTTAKPTASASGWRLSLGNTAVDLTNAVGSSKAVTLYQHGPSATGNDAVTATTANKTLKYEASADYTQKPGQYQAQLVYSFASAS